MPVEIDQAMDKNELLLTIVSGVQIREKEIERVRLLKVSKDLAMVRTKTDLSRVIENEMRDIFEFDQAMVLILSDDEKWLLSFLNDLVESYGHHTTRSENIPTRFRVSRKFLNRIFGKMEPDVIKVDELFKYNEGADSFFMNVESGIKELLLLALGDINKKTGLIVFFSSHENSFGTNAVNLIHHLSAQLSAALFNVKASEQITHQTRQISAYKKQLEAGNIYIRESMDICRKYDEIIGNSASLNKVADLISKVADTNSSVLIMGETGTGKELIARAIHHASSRKDRTMIKVNCATLPANLIESELFGHERGSFTGAVEKRIGKFELANNSTLFLDEIGELPLEQQVKLLRVIQEREFERVGGSGMIKANVRIVAATNRDLQQEVFLGNFRSDLFYRLNVFPILVPPLRDRIEDLPMLVAHFLAKQQKKTNKNVIGFAPDVMKELATYNWPGNIRELENLVERSVLMASHGVIREVSLPGKLPVAEILVGSGENIKSLEEIEKTHILSVLRYCNWRVKGSGGAAELLQLPTSTLNSKIKRFRLKK